MEQIFVKEIVVIFIVAFLGGYFAIKMKQPPLLGYLVGGVLLSSPFISRHLHFDVSKNLAQIGVALLLFTTGLEFSINKLLSLRRSVLIGSVLQMALFILCANYFFKRLGFAELPSFFLAVAFSNSSTIIVLQLLAHKTDATDTKTSQTIVGWLILQDIITVIVAVLLNSVFVSGGADPYAVFEAIAKSAVFIIVSLIFGKSIIPKIFERISRLNSFEILLILSFVFCLIVAYFAELIGLSYTLGAFLAGVMISESFVNHEIFSEIRPIRDIFSVLFYVALGSLLSIPFLFSHLVQVFGVLIFILMLKFLLVFLLILVVEKEGRKAFIVGLTLMQSGEFAFIISQIGSERQWVNEDTSSLILLVTVFSMLMTPFVILRASAWYISIREKIRKRNYKLYRLLFRYFDKQLEVDFPEISNHVIICGFGRVGSYVGKALERAGVSYVVIDSTSEIFDYCKQRGIRIVFGDASNIDILEKADTERASTLVIALPKETDTEIIATNARRLNPNIKIIARSHVPLEDRRLKVKGVTDTIEPEFEAAVSISKKIMNYLGKTSLDVTEYLKHYRGSQRARVDKNY